MVKGTTPTFYFKVNNIDNMSTISDIKLAIKCGNIFLKKSLSASEITLDTETKLVILKLSEAETLSFNSRQLQMQMKVLFTDGTISASPVFNTKVEDALDLTPITPVTVPSEPSGSDTTEPTSPDTTDTTQGNTSGTDTPTPDTAGE